MIVKSNVIKQCLDFAGKKLHAPEQRAILGATALATQPFIDLKNKDVDEKTRMTSVARTIAKIVVGTIVGIAVRKIGIDFIKKFSQYDKVLNQNGTEVVKIIGKKGRDWFVPLFTGNNKIFPIAPDKLDKKFNLYTKALGTFVATIAMVFTNFLVDAPLIKKATNVFQKILCPQEDKEGTVK